MRRATGVIHAVAMALLFFAVVTPLGVLLRGLGRDPLRLRLEPQSASYWLCRRTAARPVAMTRQL
jgi:hypothetical protein